MCVFASVVVVFMSERRNYAERIDRLFAVERRLKKCRFELISMRTFE